MLKFFNFSKFFITNYYTFLQVQLKTLGLGTSFPIFFVTKFGNL